MKICVGLSVHHHQPVVIILHWFNALQTSHALALPPTRSLSIISEALNLDNISRDYLKISSNSMRTRQCSDSIAYTREMIVIGILYMLVYIHRNLQESNCIKYASHVLPQNKCTKEKKKVYGFLLES